MKSDKGTAVRPTVLRYSDRVLLQSGFRRNSGGCREAFECRIKHEGVRAITSSCTKSLALNAVISCEVSAGAGNKMPRLLSTHLKLMQGRKSMAPSIVPAAGEFSWMEKEEREIRLKKE